jgi:predicted RNA-binding protein with PIN domain
VTRVPSHDPLDGVSRLLVDGTNLLHVLARGSSGPDRQPPAALIGRLRAAIPAETKIELVFDGPPERGLKNERIAHGVSVRYGGRYSADTILITLVEEVTTAAGAPPGGGSPAADALLVVTDDRDLRAAVTRRGARTAGAQWLLRRLDRPRLASPSVGNQRPPRIAQPSPGSVSSRDEAANRPGWSPGRGATRKKGPGKRPPKTRPG